MKSVLTGLVLATVCGLIAYGVFTFQDYSAQSTYTSTNGSVRLSN